MSNWAQRKDNNVERLSDGLTIELIHQLKDLADDMPWLSEVGQRAVQNMVAAEIDLENLRSQHAEVLGTVREFLEAVRYNDEVNGGDTELSFLMQPGFLKTQSVPKDTGINSAHIGVLRAWRALVALAEVSS